MKDALLEDKSNVLFSYPIQIIPSEIADTISAYLPPLLNLQRASLPYFCSEILELTLLSLVS